MLFHNILSGSRKKNLAILAGLGALLSAIVSADAQQTFNFDNELSTQIWNSQANWSPNELPGPLDTAILPADAQSPDPDFPALMHITDIAGSFGSTAFCRTLRLNASSKEYIGLFSSDGFPTSQERNSTLTLGTGTLGGTLEFHVLQPQPFDERTFNYGGAGTITTVLPRALDVRVAGDHVLNISTVFTANSGSIATGSITYRQIPGSGSEVARMNLGTGFSDYGLGTWVEPLTRVGFSDGSVFDGTSILNGPFGIGTVQMNGGTILLNGEGGQRTLHNPINTLAQSEEKRGHY